MKILHINKQYHVIGGTDSYFFGLTGLLEKNGHTVVPFSTKNPLNEPTPYERYFVPDILRKGGAFSRLKALGRVFYSPAIERRVREISRMEKPDVAHVHHLFHSLSPSVLVGLRREGVPIVMTIHDHKFICPHYAMSRDGVTCMECKGRKYGHAIRHKCINGALAPSIVCSLEMLLHRLLRIYEKNVDLFISPSRFLADNLSADGFMASAMMHIPNFTDTDLFTPSESVDDYVLYYGKIERPKGVHLLIEAVAELSKTRTVRCLMVGDGDDRPALEKNAGKSGGIEFLGRRSGAELRDIVRRARCVVVPSVCLENGSMVIIESMASGRPVVASRSGGNPEYVADGVTGMLFTSGDAHDLAEKLVAVLADPARADAMGRAGRKTAIERLSLKAHYEKIMVAYHAAIKAAGLR